MPAEIKRTGDFLYNVLDRYTGETATYKKVTKHLDGTTLSDAKCDGILFRKVGTEYFQRVIKGSVSPEMFGAKADGVTDDSAAIQAMFDAAKGYYAFEFTPKATYLVNASVNLPVPYPDTIIYIKGSGTVLKTAAPNVRVFNKHPLTQGDSETQMRRYHIEGFTFQGASINATYVEGQIGIFLGSTYGTIIQNCFFNHLDYGFVGSFCLKTELYNCFGTSIKKADFTYQTGIGNGVEVWRPVVYDTDGVTVIDDGTKVWTSATLTNSASNISRFVSCRAYNDNHSSIVKDASFRVYGSDSIRMNDCISEGGNNQMRADVIYDQQGSSTCRQFYIDGLHCEGNIPTEAHIRVITTTNVYVQNIIRSYNAVILDATGCASVAKIHVENIEYLGNCTYFFKSPANVKWRMRNIGGGTEGVDTTAKWVGGIIPSDAFNAVGNTWYGSKMGYGGPTASQVIKGGYLQLQDGYFLNLGGYKEVPILVSATAYTVDGRGQVGTHFRGTLEGDQTITIPAASGGYVDAYGRIVRFSKGSSTGVLTINGRFQIESTANTPIQLYSKDDYLEVACLLTNSGYWTILSSNITPPNALPHGSYETIVDNVIPKQKQQGVITNFTKTRYPVSSWAASTAYSLGAVVKPHSSQVTNLVYECIQAGTSGAGVTMSTTIGEVTTDNTVKWLCRSPWGSYNNNKIVGYRKISEDYTTRVEAVIGVDTSAARTITLSDSHKALGTFDEIQYITIVDETGSAATNPITINSETGGQTFTISTNKGSKVLYSNGTTWVEVKGVSYDSGYFDY